MEHQIIYASEQQKKALALIERVAPSDVELLICGPSGVGKELYARHAHQCSRRKDRSFVAVNCANLSPDMLENEIFGHAKGAFTGASLSSSGIAAAADGGTLFLDEVDTLPTSCQAKILRFAEMKEYRRLGENFVRKADIRIIAASNANLRQKVENGSFREDLYFRLRVAPVDIEPLAGRPDDIPVLIDHFAAKYATEMQVEPVRLMPAARERLLAYHWPGNVRELQNCIRFLTCLQLEDAAGLGDLPILEVSRPGSSEAIMLPVLPAPEEAEPEDELADLVDQPMGEAKTVVVEAFERHYLDSALTKVDGNVAEAARRSGKNRRTIFQLLKKYGLSASGYRKR